MYFEWKGQFFDYSVSVEEKGFLAEAGGDFLRVVFILDLIYPGLFR